MKITMVTQMKIITMTTTMPMVVLGLTMLEEQQAAAAAAAAAVEEGRAVDAGGWTKHCMIGVLAHPLVLRHLVLALARRRSTRAAPRGSLHEGRSTGVAPRGPLHGGVADLFYIDVRSILMVL